MAGSIVASSL